MSDRPPDPGSAVKTAAPFEIGIVVADVDRVLPFYRDVLGFAVIGDLEVPADRSRRSGLAADGYRIVRLESSGGDRLKLAQPGGGGAAGAPAAWAMNRPGGCYVTFIVEDLAALYARLVQAGTPVRSDGIVLLRAGLRLLLVADPEGNFLEFLQYDDIDAYRPRN
jgi:catechol 2,3-dioxygenase-like lactoylglutathione lyase family enzyme